jgi:hypothetical protein
VRSGTVQRRIMPKRVALKANAILSISCVCAPKNSTNRVLAKNHYRKGKLCPVNQSSKPTAECDELCRIINTSIKTAQTKSRTPPMSNNFTIHNSQFTIHNSKTLTSSTRNLFVECLVIPGLTAVVISPGSRSTPLTLAFAAQDKIEDLPPPGRAQRRLFLLWDWPWRPTNRWRWYARRERPLPTTSPPSSKPTCPGAAAGPHRRPPARTAPQWGQPDHRPGKIFGDQVLWAVDMPIPQADAPEAALRHVQTTAVRAYATANGLRQGPVHINFPFRTPLEPEQ